MGQNGLFQYYVEGECEKNLLRSLMHAKDADDVDRVLLFDVEQA